MANESVQVKNQNPYPTPLRLEEKLEQLIEALLEVKAEEVLSFDVRGKSEITDMIIICQGRSQTHTRGIAEQVQEWMKTKWNLRTLSTEGYQEGSWILLDYHEIIVHIFHPETRSYYQLEELYQGCSQKNWQ